MLWREGGCALLRMEIGGVIEENALRTLITEADFGGSLSRLCPLQAWIHEQRASGLKPP
jgi:hypothetical protein